MKPHVKRFSMLLLAMMRIRLRNWYYWASAARLFIDISGLTITLLHYRFDQPINYDIVAYNNHLISLGFGARYLLHDIQPVSKAYEFLWHIRLGAMVSPTLTLPKLLNPPCLA